jgi:pimeloyl-ACP methyl ester carboxylesterase
MDHAVTDVDSLVTFASSRHASRPVYLFGHSMGGAIAIAYALRHQEGLRGLLLSSARKAHRCRPGLRLRCSLRSPPLRGSWTSIPG